MEDHVQDHRDVGDESRVPVVRIMKRMTAAAPIPIDSFACLMASRPIVGPTWVSNDFVSGAGSAPERNTATIPFFASSWSANGLPKLPSVMRPREPMRLLMTGAVLIRSSRMMAILRPMLSPVRRSEIVAPQVSTSSTARALTISSERLTGDNIGRKMAIILDDRIKTAPVIKSRIGSRAASRWALRRSVRAPGGGEGDCRGVAFGRAAGAAHEVVRDAGRADDGLRRDQESEAIDGDWRCRRHRVHGAVQPAVGVDREHRDDLEHGVDAGDPGDASKRR